MTSERPAPLTLTAWILVVLIGGSNVVAVRITNRDLDPLWGAGLRFTTAGVMLLAIAAAARIKLPRGRALTGACIFGAFNFFGSFAFAYYALEPGGVSAALGAVILGLIPLLTLILAVLQKIETFRTRSLIGALVAVGGIAAMVGAPANAGVDVLHIAAMFAAAICAAQASVVVKRFPPVHPIAMNVVGMAVGGPLLLLASAASSETWTTPEQTATWVTLAYQIPLGSVGLFILVVYVLNHWTASAASYQFVFFPIVAAVAAALVADEPLTASIAAGAILVIAGVYIGALSGRRKRAEPVPATEP